eukprot:1021361-Alexandrium_andersonii.AAC.1
MFVMTAAACCGSAVGVVLAVAPVAVALVSGVGVTLGVGGVCDGSTGAATGRDSTILGICTSGGGAPIDCIGIEGAVVGGGAIGAGLAELEE